MIDGQSRCRINPATTQQTIAPFYNYRCSHIGRIIINGKPYISIKRIYVLDTILAGKVSKPKTTADAKALL